MKKHLLLYLASAFFLIACSASHEPNGGDKIPEAIQDTTLPYNSVHLSLGLPVDADSTDEYVLVRPQYALSYNKNLNVSNWVSWELNSNWFGDVDRYSGNFIQDPLLPEGYYRVTHNDYTNSGYDRGHMVRSEERTRTDEDNKSTFYTTNILPQMPDLNQGVWLNLEYHCEDLCKQQNKELFVLAGGVFYTKNKLKNVVTVPDSCWKIIIILNKGQGIGDINGNTEVIAVMMPNIAGIRKDTWDKYKTTIRRIEGSTGYNFLSRVSKSIQDVIENK